MLVLTRKQKQQIQIGDSITVTILKVKGHTVRVGIDAPDGVKILRGELGVATASDRDSGESAADRSAPRSSSNGEPDYGESQEPETQPLQLAGGFHQPPFLESVVAPAAQMRLSSV